MEINANVTGMQIMTSERQRITPIHGGTGHPMRLGDKIFVRIIRGSNSIDEFLSTRVADLSELIGEIRSRLRGTRGLVEMHIRNASEGWNIRRPLMLYNDTFAPRGFGNVRRTEPLTPRLSSLKENQDSSSGLFGALRPSGRFSYGPHSPSSPRMLKPYETH